MEISLAPQAGEILARLERAGFEAWCVGGCVRDSLLGRPPQDWDVTTNATPPQIKEALSPLPLVEVGARHGTVSALVEGMPVEVTTYRADGDYQDHRHPETVRFSAKIREDLARRDFTVNAMAYHPARGLLDPFGGQEDLAARVLRCVGDPARRFQEDALRILRGLRFAAVLGFALESETDRALRENRELLAFISAERIREELTRLLCGAKAGAVLEGWPEVIFAALPELAPMGNCPQETPYHCWDVWGHTLHTVDAAPPEPLLRWAALLHDCGKPAAKLYGEDGRAHFYGHAKISAQIADGLLDRLRFPRRERETLVALAAQHGTPLDPPEQRVRRLLATLGEEQFFRLLALKRADAAAHAPAYRQERIGFVQRAEALAREILARKEPLGLKDLAVNGNDLLGLGIPPGPEVGKILQRLLEKVLDGDLPNRRDALLRAAGQADSGARTNFEE